jgi:hypothetical protein
MNTAHDDSWITEIEYGKEPASHSGCLRPDDGLEQCLNKRGGKLGVIAKLISAATDALSQSAQSSNHDHSTPSL